MMTATMTGSNPTEVDEVMEMELDDPALVELVIWIMLALELMRECPEYSELDNNNVRDVNRASRPRAGRK
jgi:hypothetical protein